MPRKCCGTLSTVMLFGDCTPVTIPILHCTPRIKQFHWDFYTNMNCCEHLHIPIWQFIFQMFPFIRSLLSVQTWTPNCAEISLLSQQKPLWSDSFTLLFCPHLAGIQALKYLLIFHFSWFGGLLSEISYCCPS